MNRLSTVSPTPTRYLPCFSLSRSSDGGSVLAWSEWDGADERIGRTVVSEGAPENAPEVIPVRGSPASVQALPDGGVVATVLDGRSGSIWYWPADGDPWPVAVPGSDDADFGWGGCASCRSGDGRLWILAERWRREGVSVALGSIDADGRVRWDELRRFSRRGECRRPVLAVDGSTLIGAWDRRQHGRSDIVVAEFDATRRRPVGSEGESVVPGPAGWDLTVPAVAVDGTGTRWLSCCAERPVACDGAAVRHSEIRVWRRPSGSRNDWSFVGSVDIDRGLNPWLAAYWGYQRFATLRATPDGVWLFYEEKCDERSMDPSPGRLRGVPIGDGAFGVPVTIHEGRAAYLLERDACDSALRFASRYQNRSFEWHLPWEVASGPPLPSMSNRAPPTKASASIAPSVKTADRESVATIADATRTARRRTRRSRWPDGVTRNLYFGDPHCHSRLSKDLDGELDELHHFARDTARLDFVCFTENDCTRFTEPLTPADWATIRRTAERFDTPGRFTALVGWEYTLHRNAAWPESRDSHRSVLFTDSDGSVYPCYLPENGTPERLLERFRDGVSPSDFPPGRSLPPPAAGRVLLHHHHPVTPDVSDDRYERNVEVWSGWWRADQRERFWEGVHAALHRGLRFGFVGGSDNHERNPGLGGAITGVWAKANTRTSSSKAPITTCRGTSLPPGGATPGRARCGSSEWTHYPGVGIRLDWYSLRRTERNPGASSRSVLSLT
jgi:hypothetical protein